MPRGRGAAPGELARRSHSAERCRPPQAGRPGDVLSAIDASTLRCRDAAPHRLADAVAAAIAAAILTADCGCALPWPPTCAARSSSSCRRLLDPDPQRHHVPVQPRDDDAYLDPARPAVAGPPGAEAGNPLAVTGSPASAFGFTLAMDSDDYDRRRHAVSAGARRRQRRLHPARRAGDADVPDRATRRRPARHGHRGASASASRGRPSRRQVPATQLPTVLFVWGPGRIVPVRVDQR